MGYQICRFTLKCGPRSLQTFTDVADQSGSGEMIKDCQIPFALLTCNLEYNGTIFALPTLSVRGNVQR